MATAVRRVWQSSSECGRITNHDTVYVYGNGSHSFLSAQAFDPYGPVAERVYPAVSSHKAVNGEVPTRPVLDMVV